MRILMLSTDQKIFESGSEAQKRMLEYGKLFEELHIIIFSAKSEKRQAISISENVFLYPTNHEYKIFYLWNVLKISKKIIGNCLPAGDVPKGQKLKTENLRNDIVISCQDPFETGLVGWLLSWRYGVPLQIQIHTDIFSPYFRQESLKNKMRVILAKFLLPKADGIRVVSQRIKDSLVSNVKCQMSNVSVLPIFVDVKKLQSARPKIDLHQKYFGYDFIILMASRLSKEKNIPMAIASMAELERKEKSDKRKVLLLIVGEGPEKEKLEVKCQLSGVNSNVRFEPWTKDLISYYKTADLFLLTSNYEGYGRTVVEAMAAGLPVIMTDVGLAGEVLIDDLDGYIVPVGNAKLLADSIQVLYADLEKRKNLVAESQKVINTLDNKEEYLKKYQKSLYDLKSV